MVDVKMQHRIHQPYSPVNTAQNFPDIFAGVRGVALSRALAGHCLDIVLPEELLGQQFLHDPFLLLEQQPEQPPYRHEVQRLLWSQHFSEKSWEPVDIKEICFRIFRPYGGFSPLPLSVESANEGLHEEHVVPGLRNLRYIGILVQHHADHLAPTDLMHVDPGNLLHSQNVQPDDCRRVALETALGAGLSNANRILTLAIGPDDLSSPLTSVFPNVVCLCLSLVSFQDTFPEDVLCNFSRYFPNLRSLFYHPRTLYHHDIPTSILSQLTELTVSRVRSTEVFDFIRLQELRSLLSLRVALECDDRYDTIIVEHPGLRKLTVEYYCDPDPTIFVRTPLLAELSWHLLNGSIEFTGTIKGVEQTVTIPQGQGVGWQVSQLKRELE